LPSIDLDAGSKLKEWREHPDQFVREVFHAVPDPKQDRVLKDFPLCQQQVLKASKGTGKTTVEAWLAWNFLLTRPNPKIAATSLSASMLRDNLWTEMARWQAESKILQTAFSWTAERIYANEAPETWWMAARSWAASANKDQQANTLAGLHAEYIMFVLDESGAMPDAVMVSAEAAMSSCKEGHIIQAGNPTHLEGPLYRACTSDASRWHVYTMTGDPDDPERSPRVSIDWARSQIAAYGKDNPWVLINVFGKFPPSSLNSLIGPDEVQEAMCRVYKESDIETSARVLGIDVAREGDDSSVIFPRQGIQAFVPFQYYNLTSVQGGALVNQKWTDWNADAAFIDATGGFGAGWVDNLGLLGKSPIGIHFSSSANNAGRYFNKRAEMAFECVEWIKGGGALPKIPALSGELTNTTYLFKGDRLLLEPKESVKSKLGRSPDFFDALMLTFASPVSKHRPAWAGKTNVMYDYNPLSHEIAMGLE